MKEIQDFFTELNKSLLSFGLTDLIDILVVAGLIYYVIKLIWMMRVERVRYSWKEIAGQVVGKKQDTPS